MSASFLRRVAIIAAATVPALVLGATPSQAIVGGELAAKGEFPWMVSIGTKDLGVHLCGASLIHPDWALTAAHCVVDLDPSIVYNAVIGRANLFDTSDGEVRAISQMYVHPSYNPYTWDYDVALLKLSYSATTTPLKLSFTSHRSLWDPGDMATVTGWGKMTSGGGTVSELRKVSVPIISDSYMSSVYGWFNPETMVGAGPMSGGKDACDGDSGGPIFVNSVTGPRQVGITSWGTKPCGTANRPSAYTRVAEGPIQTWIMYQIPDLATDGAATRSGDFDGDHRADVVTFTRGTSCDVYVARSLGFAFGTGTKWHDYFGCGDETPLIGDFNGDGRDDIVTFTRGWVCDVYVATSTGYSFVGTGAKWHDMFACLGSIPAVGDVNGDGKDDIISFSRGTLCDVHVALSLGNAFGPAAKWHDMFGCGAEIPMVGDFNGDGRDDIIAFNRGYAGDVWVALASTNGFVGTGWKWTSDGPLTVALPAVGDVNGDGKDDIVAFWRGTTCDVIVNLNTGNSTFAQSAKWHDMLGCGNEVPGVGEFTGDGKDDVIAFTRGAACDAWVAVSTGSGMGSASKWSDGFGCGSEIPAGSTTW
jgi:hypothetical protein